MLGERVRVLAGAALVIAAPAVFVGFYGMAFEAARKPGPSPALACATGVLTACIPWGIGWLIAERGADRPRLPVGRLLALVGVTIVCAGIVGWRALEWSADDTAHAELSLVVAALGTVAAAVAVGLLRRAVTHRGNDPG